MKTYKTDARRALIDFMKNNAQKQFTADEIAAALAEHAGKSTVYRLLSRLCDEGELRRLPRTVERGAFYQAIPDDKCLGHLHMKCIGCGLLVHLGEDESRRILALAHCRDFTVDTKKTMIYGRCGSCEGGIR